MQSRYREDIQSLAARALHRVGGDLEVTAGDWGRVVWKQMDVTSIWSLDPSHVKRSI